MHSEKTAVDKKEKTLKIQHFKFSSDDDSL